MSIGILWFAASFPLRSESKAQAVGIQAPGFDQQRPASDCIAWKVVELQIPNGIKMVSLKADLADSEQKRERGLMFRQYLSENSGMLFVFDSPARAAFWMKNTPIPLSIAFIDSQGRILEIRSMKPLDDTVIWSVSNAVAYALEMNEGWFYRHGIHLGARIFGIPYLHGNSERRANRTYPRDESQNRTKNEVRSNGFWIK